MITLTYRTRDNKINTIKGTWSDLMRVVRESFTTEIVSWSN